MGKGKQTREAILSQAIDLSSEAGLEGLTVGVLARRVGMSKSGLYAHFQSKESLQIQVLDAAAARFIDVVLAPAFKHPRGVPRITALFERWLHWETDEFPGGCVFIAAAADFDDRHGAVRDHLVGHLKDMLGAIARAARIAVDVGQFHPDLDDEHFAYELWSVLVAYQHYKRLLGQPNAEAMARKSFHHLTQRASA